MNDFVESICILIFRYKLYLASVLCILWPVLLIAEKYFINTSILRSIYFLSVIKKNAKKIAFSSTCFHALRMFLESRFFDTFSPPPATCPLRSPSGLFCFPFFIFKHALQGDDKNSLFACKYSNMLIKKMFAARKMHFSRKFLMLEHFFLF